MGKMTTTVEQKRRIVDPEYLRECFFLSSNGDLFWKHRPPSHFKTEKAMKISNSRKAGTKVCDYYDGYLRAQVSGKKYAAHRIVWAIYHGDWPTGQIDHEDGNTTNNNISNLRDVSCSENQRNAAKKRGSSTPVSGVCWHKGIQKWTSYIGNNGKLKHLGSYGDLLGAICARKSAEIALGFHKNHGREYFINPKPDVSAIQSTGLGLKVLP
jgi:hypothetical protein